MDHGHGDDDGVCVRCREGGMEGVWRLECASVRVDQSMRSWMWCMAAAPGPPEAKPEAATVTNRRRRACQLAAALEYRSPATTTTLSAA